MPRNLRFWVRVKVHVNIAVATAAAFGRKAALALGIAALTTTAVAQTVPDQDGSTPPAGLDLPANLQIFGKADPNIRKPTAIVNNAVITGTDVDQRVALLIALNDIKIGEEERQRLRIQVLRQLIDETLQIQEAQANKIDVGQDEIDDSFGRVSRNFKRNAAEMRSWLRSVGSSERSMKRQIQGELAWNRLLRRRVQIEVSDAEIAAILKRLEDAKGTEEFHVFEIYNSTTPENAGQVFAQQRELIERMKRGESFQDLARVNSEASTKAKGGDLGFLRLQMLPEQLGAAAQGMEVGQVAGPIELPGGFSILYLADKRQILGADPRDAKLSLKQLAIQFPAGTTQAQAQSKAAEFATATQAIRGCGDVENVAGKIGAEVVGNDGMTVRQLPPQLQNMILALQVGQSTPPFGSIEDGVRVLVLCGRDDVAAGVLPSPDRIREIEEERRTNLRAQRMLRDLRRDALVEYR